MSNKTFSRGLGIIFLFLGVCGFIPGLVQPATPVGEPRAMFHYGYLFNALPINWVLAGLFVLIGVAALISSARITRSRIFERVLFSLAMVLMILGFTPGGFSNLWGFMPLFGMTSGFFLMTSLFTFYFAFVEGPLLPSINSPVITHKPHHHA